MEEIKLAIVDDNPNIVENLLPIFENHKDFTVIGSGFNGADALKFAKLQPDVILIDIDMPKMNGLISAQKIKELYPSICVILLTESINTNKIVESITSGVHGILFKDMDKEEMVQVIKATMKRKMIIFYPIQESLIDIIEKSKKDYLTKSHLIQKTILSILEDFENNYMKKSIESEVFYYIFNIQLTEREREIAKLLLKNYSNTEMAATLFLSLGTVKNYLTCLYKKLGVSTRQEAIRYLKGRLEEVYDADIIKS